MKLHANYVVRDVVIVAKNNIHEKIILLTKKTRARMACDPRAHPYIKNKKSKEDEIPVRKAAAIQLYLGESQAN